METFDKVPPSVRIADGGLGMGQIIETEATEEQEHVEMWSELHEELLEKVIARLPFVKLFQVPALSRAWRVTFRSPAFQGEVTSVSHRWPLYSPVHLSRKGLVGYDAAAQSWEKLFTLSFLPYVPLGDDIVRLCSGAGSLIGFARRGNSREREFFRLKQTTFPISFDVYLEVLHAEEEEKSRQDGTYRPRGPGITNKPYRNFLRTASTEKEVLQARFLDFRRRLQEFCMADTVDDKLPQETKEFYSYINASLNRSPLYDSGIGKAFDVYVTNVVTKEWKILPSRPCMQRLHIIQRPDIIQLVAVGTSAYKVILMTLPKQGSLESTEGPFRVQIYDSRPDSWVLRNSSIGICRLEMILVQAVVYLDSEGVLFIIVRGWGANGTSYEILAYDLEDNSWTRIPNPVGFSNHEFLICGLVVCGSDVMLVTGRRESRAANVDPGSVAWERLLVYRLEIDFMSFEVFSRGLLQGLWRVFPM